MFRALLVSAWLGILAAACAFAQSYTFLRVVDERTPRPDGQGNFYPVTPSLEDNTVVFLQGAFCAGCPSPDSIWSANLDTGALTKIVDTSQTIPGSSLKFDRFDGNPFLKRGRVVFQAFDPNGRPGLYSVAASGGPITRLADTTTPIPGGSGVFIEFVRGGFSHDGSTAVFATSGGPNGVYSVKLDGTGLARVADGNTPVNSDACDVFPVTLFGNPSISNGTIALRGQTTFDSSNGYNAFFVGPLTRTVNPACSKFSNIANSLQKLPGDSNAAFHTRYNYGWIDGSTYYFRADDANSTYGGIFSAPASATSAGGAITKIVDTATVLPTLGAVGYVNNFDFVEDQGNVVFYATDPTGQKGQLNLAAGGSVSKIIGAGDTLDGFTVRSPLAPPFGALRGADLAFVWARSDFVLELSVARRVSSSVSIGGVANSASYRSDAIAPGEVVTVFGTALGGTGGLITAALDANGRVAQTLSGARLLFDGLAAPLVYVGAGGATQASAIVPYGIAGRQSVTVTAEYQGNLSAPFPIKVIAASPGIFTADASGKGQGAIQNEDGTNNSAANPAARGATIVLYAAGVGDTSPAGVDGLVSGATPPKPAAPVSITIGGVAATPSEILYQGMAPFAVTGLYQMNVRIPAGAPTGNQPVVLTVGGVSSQADVTVAVK